MDTSRLNEVKAPQHFKTPRSYEVRDRDDHGAVGRAVVGRLGAPVEARLLRPLEVVRVMYQLLFVELEHLRRDLRRTTASRNRRRRSHGHVDGVMLTPSSQSSS